MKVTIVTFIRDIGHESCKLSVLAANWLTGYKPVIRKPKITARG